ncbi:MAG TPA: AraC family transcriptional regulator [Cyclobacteriaceae bacterium]|nr:AraC family transcriptional regulator [Cyclobacteriaceae bacterium]
MAQKKTPLIVKALYIRGMVCNRCIKVLHDELSKINVKTKSTRLGRALVEFNPKEVDVATIQLVLRKNGFELITDREQQMVDHIKTFILEIISASETKTLPKRFSDAISKELGFNYSHLSRMFTHHERVTIEKYIIVHKIEKIKELLEYDDHLNLEEVVDKLNYSSVSHLSKQFKEVTGISLRDYKNFLKHLRKPLDRLKPY